MNKLISFILPVHNEENSLVDFFPRLLKTAHLESKYEFEFIFIDDGSTDNSLKKLIELKQQNGNVKILELTRNFGKELALSAGLQEAKGEAVIMLDTDLQHPPELVAEFLRKWESGVEIVVGVRNKSKSDGYIKRFGSYLFYKIMAAISETKIVSSATDFRLLDKIVLEHFNNFTEHQRMTRGLIDWLGFKTDYVYFDADERKSGKAGYGFFKLLHLALSTFVSHSLFPLKLAGYLGVIITFLSGGFGLFILFERFIFNDPFDFRFSGPAILATLSIFLIGIVLICLGLVALYIGQIHTEVTNRPLYVVRKKYD